MDLAQIRNEYLKQKLRKGSVDSDPLKQLQLWLQHAREAQCPEYTAMILATANADGHPSTRIVLLKYIDDNSLVFFTNYRSHKAKDIAINNQVSAHFFWPELERQVKVEGLVHKTSPEISDKYFNERPFYSKISAIISDQSSDVMDRKTLENRWKLEKEKWKGIAIERPDYWGGYRIKPTRIEFWQGRAYRLHDRLRYQKSIDGWDIKRLSP